MAATKGRGPLDGIRVVEFAALGPLAQAGMMLAAMGAQVDRIDRPDPTDEERVSSSSNVLNRGRRSIVLDLKTDADRETARDLMARADIVMEGFRPGVMERLGLGPDDILPQNEHVIYARMSGWRRDGARASAPGHDINFLAAAGVLDAIGTTTSGPVPPLMLVGDFGAGMNLAFALVCALREREISGRGQVIEGSIHESTMSLGTFLFGAVASGRWSTQRGTNAWDTGAHFYNVYRTRDDRWLSVGSVEPHFYAALLRVLGVSIDDAPQWDRDRWPALTERFAQIIASRDLAEWEKAFDGVDACVETVRNVTEVAADPRLQAEGSLLPTPMGVLPRVTARFSRSAEVVGSAAPEIGAHSEEIRGELSSRPASGKGSA